MLLAFSSLPYDGSSAMGLTSLQYQKDEHLMHRFKEPDLLLHPWQALIPSTSVENC
jgi:hypothetical protein